MSVERDNVFTFVYVSVYICYNKGFIQIFKENVNTTENRKKKDMQILALLYMY